MTIYTCSLHYSSNRSSPLLLASSSGALAAVKCLIDLGAYVLRKDDNGNNVIHLAALRFHTNVLEFFIQWAHPDVPVWRLLVGKNSVKYTDTNLLSFKLDDMSRGITFISFHQVDSLPE